MYEGLVKRFLRYVKVDTQSSETSETFPSTAKQFNLLNMLKKEMTDMGMEDIELDENGYLMGSIPGNTDAPVIGFISHVDTSPEVTDENVKPNIHKNYDGKPIVLPGDSSVVITTDENPELKKFIGADIITSDGTTLLGADDKAGVAEIMEAAAYLLSHPEIKHGKIRVAFTPDEEIGKGAERFDVKKFGAKFAYTMDGSFEGEIEDENFNAACGNFVIKGVNVHPGTAKNKMVNAIRISADIIERIKKDESPETTEGMQGFFHLYEIKGSVEETLVKVLVRDFSDDGFEKRKAYLKMVADEVGKMHPRAEVSVEVSDTYYNMKRILDKYPEVTKIAINAIKKCGMQPIRKAIRGGTDGAHLTRMNLPTPNIFTGGGNFHGKKEYAIVPSMEKAVDVILEICKSVVELN